MNAKELQTPPTEQEISNVLYILEVSPKERDIIRRLAFQRECLRSKLEKYIEADKAKKEI